MRKTTAMVEQAQVVTAPVVAQMLGITRATVIRKAQLGELPVALKLPGRSGAWLFPRAEIERLRDAEIERRMAAGETS